MCGYKQVYSMSSTKDVIIVRICSAVSDVKMCGDRRVNHAHVHLMMSTHLNIRSPNVRLQTNMSSTKHPCPQIAHLGSSFSEAVLASS